MHVVGMLAWLDWVNKPLFSLSSSPFIFSPQVFIRIHESSQHGFFHCRQRVLPQVSFLHFLFSRSVNTERLQISIKKLNENLRDCHSWTWHRRSVAFLHGSLWRGVKNGYFTVRLTVTHVSEPSHEIKCVLSVKQSNFNERRIKSLTLAYSQGQGGWLPPSLSYGQPDHKYPFFYTSPKWPNKKLHQAKFI